eukprot:1179317-Prorocentrum_minimum.AAC.2
MARGGGSYSLVEDRISPGVLKSRKELGRVSGTPCSAKRVLRRARGGLRVVAGGPERAKLGAARGHKGS